MLDEYAVKLKQASIYHQGYLALHRIDFDLQAREFAFLFGQTGSGKSSLLRTLHAQLPLQEGEGRVLDIALAGISPEDIALLRRQIGWLSLEVELLPQLSLEENLLWVLEITDWDDAAARQERVQHLLADLSLTAVAHKKAAELSKTQYISGLLARALLQQPRLLLLDDPTALLDEAGQNHLFHFVHQYHTTHPISVLWATNDTRLLQRSLNHWVCEQGQLRRG